VSGTVERETAKDMIVRYSPGAKRITVGADKGFDTADFVSDMRDFNVTPHVAQNTTNRLSAIDGRTIRHCGYEVSQQKRKRVEEPFGWARPRRIGAANAARREETRLQVHADNGCLRSHQVAQVDRSNRLNDRRQLKHPMSARSKSIDNAKPGYDATWVAFSAAC
jgi:hypothetical protein